MRLAAAPVMDSAVITNPAALTSLVQEWRALWHRCRVTTPFQSPDWLVPWWDVFAPGELRIVTVRRGGELIGLAPLYREAGLHGGRLLPIGAPLSDYLDVLLDPRHQDEAARAITGAIEDMDDVDACEWGELAPDAAAFRLRPTNGWNGIVSPASACPVLRLAGASDRISNCIPQSRLRYLRTARRRVARRGDSAIVEGDEGNSAALLAELARLHNKRWHQIGSRSVFDDPRILAFHEAAGPGLMQQGLARLYALMIDDVTAGVYFGLQHGDHAYAYVCGFDPDFAFERPGSVLIGNAIEQAAQEGAGEFHFLRGREPYKYDWGAVDRMNSRMLLYRGDERRARA